ncbi:hypothetical protein CDAR_372491 [Caerostris darwini]|uniref:Uncharacterized protein n=1 Tax=Caerostris darwini TaxID=1538125 RepID=A0AAV4T5V0_9ARAC|nr:hypothetical protein CDAR_372491 [Caerostris darwini]
MEQPFLPRVSRKNPKEKEVVYREARKEGDKTNGQIGNPKITVFVHIGGNFNRFNFKHSVGADVTLLKRRMF